MFSSFCKILSENLFLIWKFFPGWELKMAVDVILSDLPFEKMECRFTSVSFKTLSV